MSALDVLSSWLKSIGQRVGDNKNGVIFYDAGELATSVPEAPQYIPLSPLQELCAPGFVIARNTTTGALTWKNILNESGQVTEKNSATIQRGTSYYPPYSSDSAAVRTDTTGYMESYSRGYTADGAGNIASAELLPGAGVGLKWVLWDISVDSRATLTGGTASRCTLSDMTSNRGDTLESPIYGAMIHPGPYKQSTANTAINLTGVTTASSLVFVSFRCARVT